MDESIYMEEIQGTEQVASFGEAVLLRDSKGRVEIVGGNDDEKKQAREWAEKFLNDGAGVRWYSRAFTRQVKLPRLRRNIER